MDLDQLCMFGSGALLVTVPPEAVRSARTTTEADTVADIGTVTDGRPGVDLDDELIVDAPPEALYELWT